MKKAVNNILYVISLTHSPRIIKQGILLVEKSKRTKTIIIIRIYRHLHIEHGFVIKRFESILIVNHTYHISLVQSHKHMIVLVPKRFISM